MKKIFLIVLLTIAVVCTAGDVYASGKVRVLVIDSGTDLNHKLLRSAAAANLSEKNGQPNIDDDGNGYIDDVYGWNFVEDNSTLVQLKDSPKSKDYDRILTCMDLLGKLQRHGIGEDGLSVDELKFLGKSLINRRFWPWVGFVGGWAHGTHVAGIVASQNDVVELKAIKHLPTGPRPHTQIARRILEKVKFIIAHLKKPKNTEKLSLKELKKAFTQEGKEGVKEAERLGNYIASLNPRVINCSFGTDNRSVMAMMKHNMVKSWGWVDPTKQEIQTVANLFVTHAMLPRDKVIFGKAKDALVVISAGNSSENNDNLVISPNNVDLPNTLIVAATNDDKDLAQFSSYGHKNVDIAVPGVNIYSSFPGNKMGFMSGTSMAAPLVANYASKVLHQNPHLTTLQLKQILMKTVDKKSWLINMVKSEGVINLDRAMLAAKLMQNGKNLTQAVSDARKAVKDKYPNDAPITLPDLRNPEIRSLYFSNLQ